MSASHPPLRVPLLTAIACYVGFLLIALVVRLEALPEHVVMLGLRAPEDLTDAWGPRWLEVGFRDVTALGSTTIVAIFLIFAVTILLLRREVAPAIFVASTMVVGRSFAKALKLVFDRPRPDVVPHLVEVDSASFPSGHAMTSTIAAALAVWLVLRTAGRPEVHHHRAVRRAAVTFGVLVVGAVGFSRVYLGVHWPTDVIGGALAGLAWWCTCLCLWYVYLRRATSR